MTAAIVDVAHIVTAHALETGDLDLAAFSARTSYTAAPYDEIARLDLIGVDHALGNHDAADTALADDILNRSDDALGPVDLPRARPRSSADADGNPPAPAPRADRQEPPANLCPRLGERS